METESLRADPGQALASGELTLRALRVFVTVEEAGSMALAAGRLGTSASAITQQVSNLERVLGAQVFDRSARPIALTPAGSLLRVHAHRILEAVGEAKAEMLELNLASLPELRLAMVDDIDATVTPKLIWHLSEHYPSCVFSVASGRSDDLTGALLHREADIIVTAEPPDEPVTYERFPVLREPFILVTASGLLRNVDDVVAALSAAPFVHYDRTMPMGRAIDSHLRRVRMTVPQRYTFDSSRSLYAMVQQCGGWAITTPLGVLDSPRFRNQLDVHPLPFAGFARTIELVARRGELGKLPGRIAGLMRDMFDAAVVPEVLAMAPWCEGGFQVLSDAAAKDETPAGPPKTS
jgi:DNA-binding transcriptional LysR family regulator